MEIKTEFLDAYTNEIDILLNYINNQKVVICGLYSFYIAFNFWVCLFILSKINLFFLASS